jgi:hypothetical protein
VRRCLMSFAQAMCGCRVRAGFLFQSASAGAWDTAEAFEPLWMKVGSGV